MASLPDAYPAKGGWDKTKLCSLLQAGHPRALSAAIPVDQQGWPTVEQWWWPLAMQASPVLGFALVSSNTAEQGHSHDHADKCKLNASAGERQT